jgi:hypothetical protein
MSLDTGPEIIKKTWHTTQLAILFNLPFIEDLVSILWHQHDMVGDLAIVVAQTS